jgi:hypothetical protein
MVRSLPTGAHRTRRRNRRERREHEWRGRGLHTGHIVAGKYLRICLIIGVIFSFRNLRSGRKRVSNNSGTAGISGAVFSGICVDRRRSQHTVYRRGYYCQPAPALFAGSEVCLLEMILCGLVDNDVLSGTTGTGEPDHISGPRSINLGF